MSDTLSEMKDRELVKTGWRASRWPLPIFFILAFSLLLGLYWGLRLGAISYSSQQVFTILSQPFVQSAEQDILIDLRLPRLLAAGLVGAGLAISGTIMQALTRNRLADPGLLGIPAGAGLLLLLKIMIFPNSSQVLSLLACMLGASLAAGLILWIGQGKQSRRSPLALILSGIMVTALIQALGQGLAILYGLSTHVIGLQAGSLTNVTWASLVWGGPPLLLGPALACFFAHSLTILSLDDDLARGLGQETTRMNYLFFTIVILLSASSVALVGSLSFIGLIIPNLLTALLPKDYRVLLPLSGLFGASFLTWLDTISRTLHPPYETPLSSLVSFVGFPFFLWLIRKGDLA